MPQTSNASRCWLGPAYLVVICANVQDTYDPLGSQRVGLGGSFSLKCCVFETSDSGVKEIRT